MLKVTELTKILARKWEHVDQETEDYYQAKNKKAKELYEEELKLYESTYGKVPSRGGIFG